MDVCTNCNAALCSGGREPQTRFQWMFSDGRATQRCCENCSWVTVKCSSCENYLTCNKGARYAFECVERHIRGCCTTSPLRPAYKRRNKSGGAAVGEGEGEGAAAEDSDAFGDDGAAFGDDGAAFGDEAESQFAWHPQAHESHQPRALRIWPEISDREDLDLRALGLPEDFSGTLDLSETPHWLDANMLDFVNNGIDPLLFEACPLRSAGPAVQHLFSVAEQMTADARKATDAANDAWRNAATDQRAWASFPQPMVNPAQSQELLQRFAQRPIGLMGPLRDPERRDRSRWYALQRAQGGGGPLTPVRREAFGKLLEILVPSDGDKLSDKQLEALGGLLHMQAPNKALPLER